MQLSCPNLHKHTPFYSELKSISLEESTMTYQCQITLYPVTPSYLSLISSTILPLSIHSSPTDLLIFLELQAMFVLYPFPLLGMFSQIQLTEGLPSSLCWNHLFSHKVCSSQITEFCNLPFQFKCLNSLFPFLHFYFPIEVLKVIYLYMCPCILNHFNLCPPVCSPMDYSLPDSSVHAISRQKS